MFWDFIGSLLRDLEELSIKISGMGVPFHLNKLRVLSARQRNDKS
jgi:hypothetical protein